MANHVNHRLTISGPEEQLKEIDERLIFTNQNGELSMKFNVLDPIPSELYIEDPERGEDGLIILFGIKGGAEQARREILDRLKAQHKKESLDDDTFLEKMRTIDPEMLDMGERCIENFIRYGYANSNIWKNVRWGGEPGYEVAHSLGDRSLWISFTTSFNTRHEFFQTLSKKYPDCRFDLSTFDQFNVHSIVFTIKNGSSVILKETQQDPYLLEEELEQKLEEIKTKFTITDSMFLAISEKVGLDYVNSDMRNSAIPHLEHVLNTCISEWSWRTDHPDLLVKYENLARAIAQGFATPDLVNKGIECFQKAIGIRSGRKSEYSLIELYKDHVGLASLFKQKALIYQSVVHRELSEEVWEKWDLLNEGNSNQSYKDLTALILAAGYGCQKIVKELLNKGVDPNQKDSGGNTPLFEAVNSGHFETVKLLLAKGANVNQSVNSGWTPLMIAVANNHHKIVTLLLNKGADANSRCGKGISPLFLATEQSDETMQEILLKAGAEPLTSDEMNRIMRQWSKQLMSEIKRGNIAEVKSFLEKGVSVNHIDLNGATPLCIAAGCGQVEIVTLLLEKGADKGHGSSPEEDPLHYAIEYPKILEILLEHGPNTHTAINTLLHNCVTAGAVESLKLLIEHGADTNVAIHGTPIITSACLMGNEEIIRLLLDHRADIDAALLLISLQQYNSTQLLDLLISHGANVNSFDKEGTPLLHQASLIGNVKLVKCLLDHNPDVDQIDSNGKTALIVAAQQGHTDIVELLLNHGADPNLRDEDNLSARYWAYLKGKKRMEELLEKKGAKGLTDPENVAWVTQMLLGNEVDSTEDV